MSSAGLNKFARTAGLVTLELEFEHHLSDYDEGHHKSLDDYHTKHVVASITEL